MANASVTFVGTATTLLRLGDFTVLTDPNFLHQGQRAYLGYGMWSKRRTEPAYRVDELPPLDAVVLSHLHGDHFDRVARRGLPRGVPILTTRHAAHRLDGVFPTLGMRAWQAQEFRKGEQTLRVTSVPGQHAPGPLQAVLPPVMGSVLDLEQGGERLLRLYITGDTLYRGWLRRIPERFPDIDTMLIHLGGTRILGLTVTMDGVMGRQMLELVRPGLTLPIHYDDYTVFRSPLNDFLAETRRHGLDGMVRPILRGDTVDLPVRALAGSARLS